MNMKRQRGRNNGRNNNKPHMPTRSQNFDSSGPEVRIRGNAYQVLEKYLALARDATAAGDRVAAENYYQHAEHYFRVINANNDGQHRQQGGAQQQPNQQNPQQYQQPNNNHQPHQPQQQYDQRMQPHDGPGGADAGNGPQPLTGPALSNPGDTSAR